MGSILKTVNTLIEMAEGDMGEVNDILEGYQSRKAEIEKTPFEERSRKVDDEWVNLADITAGLSKYIMRSEGGVLGDVEEGYECDSYRRYVDIPVEPEEMVEPLHNYPHFKDNYVGEVFNRRSVFLEIHWGKVQGTPTLRVAINRVGSRGEKDETLLKFDMPAVPDENGNLKHPKQYVFNALNEAKKRFSEKVGCVVCGNPDIWFKKIQTPKHPLYRIMWKELDFADPKNRVCRECYKRVNPTVSDFDPHPELDPETSIEEILAAYNLNRYTGKEWYIQDKGEGLVSDVNETIEVHGHTRLDSPDYMATFDRQESILQLGG